ncbi:hypothetical protein VHA_000176 [Grimontia hollisae CIP 101886]|uniref:Uncharacterized protein n=1 Tax=Grimontia hollisae CIP 101886 TaxID=675812 RepID=D0I345_GRIHO|nr:hypothetical protein VHA_000176 [Grimontia hollisae CIP 101886]
MPSGSVTNSGGNPENCQRHHQGAVSIYATHLRYPAALKKKIPFIASEI